MSAPAYSAVICADASAVLGGGHVVRSLALANALSGLGWQCAFVTSAESLQAVPALADSAMRIITLSADADPANIAAALGAATNWLIVDHYGLDAAFHRACRAFARRILVIDDLADRQYDCDVLLDATPGRTAGAYEGRVPEHCHLLLGPAYALLRPQFTGERKRLPSPGNKAGGGGLFVSFGMTDPRGYTLLALEGIRRAGLSLPVEIALGGISPCKEALLEQAEQLPFPVKIHDGDATMARSMTRADLAIGGGGGMALERCCMGLPSIVITVADNQVAISAALAKAGAILALGPAEEVDPDRIAFALRELCHDSVQLAAMAEAAAATCDGLGIQRTVQELSDNE